MKKIIIIFLLITCSANFLQAQTKQVKGTISDDKGPIAGASIVEKGISPANGVAADDNGNFTINLKGKSNILLVSAINYLSKEVKADAPLLNISLILDPKSLDEVVVIGYGKQKKITVTGALSSVTGDLIRQNPAASLQNGLVGRLPGYSAQQRTGKPGADGAAFYIRGVSTYNGGGSNPLIIVDDVEYSYDQFSVLDPNEIESVSILKDASTTAIYGIKGANGVMVVSTRRGKAGPAKITLRTEYASLEPTVLPKYLNAYDAARLYDTALIHDGKPALFQQADLDLFQNGQDPYGHPNIDWKNVLFKKYSHQIRTNVDISGGTDKVKYFVSLGFINQGGILNDFSSGQGFNGNYYNQRFNYRSNLDIKVTKSLDVKINLFGTRNEVNTPNIFNSSTNGGNNDPFYEYTNFLSLAPFAYPIKNPDGSWGYSNWAMAPNSQSAYNANNIIARLSLGGYNRNYNDNMSFNSNAVQKLDFITKGLSAKVVLAYNSNYTYDKGLTRTNIPAFIYNPTTSTYTVRDANVYTLEKLNTNYQPRQTFRELTIQAHINYDRNFGNNHVYGLFLISRDSKVAVNTSIAAATYNYIPVNFQGTSYRVGYDFKNKYLFQFNMAINGTDRFDNGKKYGTFPAVSAGWNIAQEGFFKKVLPKFNVFKLRASYGVVGSDALPPGSLYSYRNDYLSNGSTGRIYTGNFGISSTPVTTSIQEGTIENKDVTWEKENKLDIGLEFALFNNKLTGTFDWFNNNRYDILTTRGTVSQIFGQNLPPVNLGKVNNKGFEFEIGYNDYIGKNFRYSIKGNYAVAINKRIFIDEPTFQYAYQQATGRPINDPLIYKWTGHFYTDAADIAKRPVSKIGLQHPGDLEYADINGDGVIDASDRGYFAYPNLPNTNYGFSIDLGYKNFNFSVLFQGTMNGSVYTTSPAFFSNLTNIQLNAWTPALGDNAQYPWLTIGNNTLNDPTGAPSTYWFRSSDYLRLRTAQISYQFSKTLLKKLKMDDIRVYVNGNNLLTWSSLYKFYSQDPEINNGVSVTQYPTQRTVNLGVNITF